MTINKQDIRHVAKLAKLEISDESIEKITGQMDNIIGMVEKLSELDTEDVPEMYHGISIQNIMREDKAVPGTDRELLFKNVKESKDGMIRVPAMIDNEEGDA